MKKILLLIKQLWENDDFKRILAIILFLLFLLFAMIGESLFENLTGVYVDKKKGGIYGGAQVMHPTEAKIEY